VNNRGTGTGKILSLLVLLSVYCGFPTLMRGIAFSRACFARCWMFLGEGGFVGIWDIEAARVGNE